MNKDKFLIEVKKLGIELSEQALNQLEQYYEILIDENSKYNLTNITEKESVYLKHFYDSLTIFKAITLNNQYICDVGTGAGFPGIVLKIAFPNLKVDLLDATSKKCQFLKLVIEKLSLKNINVINARAEDYGKKNREIYDIVTSRAVAPLKHLLEYSIPMLKVNGKFVAMKANLDDEINDISKYYQKLYIDNEKIINFKLPIEESNRSIYTIDKKKATPTIYPRSYSQIKNKVI